MTVLVEILHQMADLRFSWESDAGYHSYQKPFVSMVAKAEAAEEYPARVVVLV